MKALKTVRSFDGSGDVERWLDRMEMAVQIDGLEEKEAQVLALH